MIEITTALKELVGKPTEFFSLHSHLDLESDTPTIHPTEIPNISLSLSLEASQTNYETQDETAIEMSPQFQYKRSTRRISPKRYEPECESCQSKYPVPIMLEGVCNKPVKTRKQNQIIC